MSQHDPLHEPSTTPSPETSQPTGRFRRRFLSLALVNEPARHDADVDSDDEAA
jgi:hypothetical protein